MNRKRRAFSLIELLIALALFSVLLGFYLGMNAKNQVKTQLVVTQHRLNQIILYARNQALRGHSALVLHAIKPEDWSQGMMVFKDNKNHRLTHQEELVYEWRSFASPFKIKWNGFRSPYYLIFSQNLERAAMNGHFSIFYQGIEIGRVIINRLGRIHYVNYI